MRGILARLKRLHDSEEGMALAGVVMLSAFVFIIISSLALTSMASTKLTADNRSSVITLSSAESGIDAAVAATTTGQCQVVNDSAEFGYSYAVYRSASATAPTGTSDVGVSPGCPENGDKYIVITSSGTNARGENTEITSTYQWIVKPAGTVEGALVSGGGNVSLTNLVISQAGGDLVLIYGDFNCNNSTSVSGDVIVIGGDVQLTNGCHVYGSLYASGDVDINSAVGVDGDVYALGNLTIENPTMIKGSVYTQGTATLSSGTTIQGSLTSEGIGATAIGNATINHNVSVAGQLRIENATIGGNIASSNTALATVFPTSTLGGFLHLAGNVSSWGSGPQAPGGIILNATVPSPNFVIPKELQSGAYTWVDYQYKADDWTKAGYTILPKSTCNFQGNASLVSQINNLTSPTVVDMQNCSNVNLYGVTLTLKTDVTFIVNQANSAQSLTVNSSSSAPHQFNIITPDSVKDSSPTCSPGQGTLNIYQMVMSSAITGFIYSPCTIAMGGPPSQINGQIYAGITAHTGSGMGIAYTPISVPGFPTSTNAVNVNYDSSATTRAMPLLVSRTEN